MRHLATLLAFLVALVAGQAVCLVAVLPPVARDLGRRPRRLALRRLLGYGAPVGAFSGLRALTALKLSKTQNESLAVSGGVGNLSPSAFVPSLTSATSHPHPRVEPAVQDIRQDVTEDYKQGEYEKRGPGQELVLREERLQVGVAYALESEYPL